MAINRADLEVRLSGGASNTDPDASLGGIISSERVLSQSASAPTNVTGVVINYACGNALGDGTLTFANTATTLTWKPSGQVVGSAIDVSVDGKYVITDSIGAQQIHVTVTAASLPGTDQSDTDITIANIANESFDDISKAESLAGDTEYRCFYIKNTHGTDSALAVTIWLDSDASGDDAITMAADLAGIGDGSTTGVADTIADEDTAPSPALTFTAPATQATGIVFGTLTPGQTVAFWLKRTCPADVSVTTTSDLSSIGISANL